MMQISDYKTTDLSALPELLRHRTQMTRIGRIFTDIFNPCASVLSVRSVFYPEYNEPQISRNFGLRSVGVCEAYPSFDKTFIKFFDKPFLKVYADERRYIVATDYIKTTHRKVGYELWFIDNNEKASVADSFIPGRKERKAVQQESLCPLCSLWLNISSAPAHGRAPPALRPRLSRAGG